MSSLSIEKQTPYSTPFTYGSFGPFARQTRARTLSTHEFSHILSFLGPKALERSEKVCHNWAQFINATGQWKRQCQIQLGISTKIDPERCLQGFSYKQLIFSSILDESVYELYIGKVVPQNLEEISLEKWNDLDPCDQTKTIGEEYTWMYYPDYIEITDLEGFSLDKPDDPKDPEAPKLIRKEESIVGRFAKKIGCGAKRVKHKNKVLKVAMTMNNMKVLFKYPKTGYPSTYHYDWDNISEQHGNKRIPAGWIYMRRQAIGMNLSYLEQQELAKEKGVIIPSLQHRILFNFLEHVRTGIYPDGQDPLTYARTSTLTHDWQGLDCPSGCGSGGSSGLSIDNVRFLGYDDVSVAVALPAEDQDMGS